MANLSKNTYNIIYNISTGILSGDTIISVENNTSNDVINLFSSFTQISFENPTSDKRKFQSQILYDETLDVGNYTISCEAQYYETISFYIELSVINQSDTTPTPSLNYALKYWLEYKGISNDIFKLEIKELGYLGDSIEIHGKVKHNYEERKELIKPIIASTLEIDLEVNLDLTLDDLYSENERHFLVVFKRNNEIIFNGFLKPDGIGEDYVNDKWALSLDAIDGLSILKDLSFVKYNGAFYSGKLSQFQIIQNCLHRIGYDDLPINISLDFPIYEGFNGTETILKSVFVNTERFYQDSERQNIMDCESVLKSILEIYNATIIQMNGEWWIFRSIDVKENMLFKKYIGENSGTELTWNAQNNIGSHIDGFAIHHINSNQRKSIAASIQAYRLNYKYGIVKTITDNPELEMGVGINCNGWLFNSINGKVKRNISGKGIYIDEYVDDVADVLLVQSNQQIEVITGDVIDVAFKMNFIIEIIQGFAEKHYQQHDLVFVFETANYIFDGKDWVNKSSNPNARLWIYKDSPKGVLEQTISLPPVKESGNLSVSMYLRKLEAGTINRTHLGLVTKEKITFELLEINIYPNKNSNIKGEYHTLQRTSRVSSVTKSDKTVNNGDSVSDVYLGTLYKPDGTPTNVWNRVNSVDLKPLLQISCEDVLSLSPKPLIIFEGDIWGYLPYLSFITINNILGDFQISKYSYDTERNINNTIFKEFKSELLTDTRYEFTYDYGSETKVLIKA